MKYALGIVITGVSVMVLAVGSAVYLDRVIGPAVRGTGWEIIAIGSAFVWAWIFPRVMKLLGEA